MASVKFGSRRCLSYIQTLCRCNKLLNLRSQSIQLSTSNTLNMKENDDYSPAQVKQLSEQCIAVDENDGIVGPASKKECHILEDRKIALLHRAFSVFLFNENGELLLQQRSPSKITFPEYFTNSCCSHPRFDNDETDNDNKVGIKKAAQRRLNFELGIPLEQIPLDDFQFLTRVHYAAPANDKWGEHEIDYVLILQKNVDLNPNFEEVKFVCYVNKDGLRDFLYQADRSGLKITPWFKFITDKLLYAWWDHLTNLNDFAQDSVIHRGPIVPRS